MEEKLFLDSYPLSADPRNPARVRSLISPRTTGIRPSFLSKFSSLTKTSGVLRRTNSSTAQGQVLHWAHPALDTSWQPRGTQAVQQPGCSQSKSLFLLHVLYTILEMYMHSLLKNKLEKSLSHRGGFVETKVPVQPQTVLRLKNLKISMLIYIVLETHLLCCSSWAKGCRG